MGRAVGRVGGGIRNDDRGRKIRDAEGGGQVGARGGRDGHLARVLGAPNTGVGNVAVGIEFEDENVCGAGAETARLADDGITAAGNFIEIPGFLRVGAAVGLLPLHDTGRIQFDEPDILRSHGECRGVAEYGVSAVGSRDDGRPLVLLAASEGFLPLDRLAGGDFEYIDVGKARTETLGETRQGIPPVGGGNQAEAVEMLRDVAAEVALPLDIPGRVEFEDPGVTVEPGAVGGGSHQESAAGEGLDGISVVPQGSAVKLAPEDISGAGQLKDPYVGVSDLNHVGEPDDGETAVRCLHHPVDPVEVVGPDGLLPEDISRTVDLEGPAVLEAGSPAQRDACDDVTPVGGGNRRVGVFAAASAVVALPDYAAVPVQHQSPYITAGTEALRGSKDEIAATRCGNDHVAEIAVLAAIVVRKGSLRLY